MRQTREFFVILLVPVVRDDRHAFGHEPAQAARVVKMIVSVDEVFDGLIRNDSLRFRNYRVSAGLTVASFNDDDVILEVHRDAGVSAKNKKDSVSKLA